MIRLLLLSLLSSIVFVACKEDPPDELSPIYSVSPVAAPSFLVCGAESLYVFSVRVEDLNNLGEVVGGVDSVICRVIRPDGSNETIFRLYDDGNTQQFDSPAYASERSSDIVANNGTYTRGVWSNLLCSGEEGNYQFKFEAIRGEELIRAPSFTVEVRDVIDCVFGDFQPEIMLSACFASHEVSIEITPDEHVPIDTVRVYWMSGDTIWWTADLEKGTGNEWSFNMEPSLFGCTPSGLYYVMQFDAFTRFGLNCSYQFNDGIGFENGLPVLSNPQMSDTMYRPVVVGDSNVYQMFVNYDDCELSGWSQNQTVWFQVSRDVLPDEWPPPGNTFFLRNDGVSPDLQAGDSIASSYLVVKNLDLGLLNNVYYFRYFAIDCASGDTSIAIIDSTRIIQSGAIINGSSANTLDLGLSFFK